MKQSITNEEAGKKLAAAEEELKSARARLTAMKKELFRIDDVTDYEFGLPGGKSVKLSALFGDHQDLIVIHNMGKGCPYCTLWADGFQSLQGHLQNRTAFVISSPTPPEDQQAFAKDRQWQLPMVSTAGTSFIEDMGMTADKGMTWPGMSSFHKTDSGKIVRVAKDFFGPGDDYNPVWHMFELLSDGTKGWQPKLKYS